MCAENPANGPEETPEQEFERRLAKVTNIGADALLEYEIAGHWKGKYRCITWYIPDTKEIASLLLEAPASTTGEWWLSIGVSQEGDDRRVSYYLRYGSREEMLQYLKRPEAREVIIRSIKELRESL